MSAYEDWEKFQKELSLTLPKATYNAWLHGSRGVEWNGDCITVEVINGYAVDWLNSRLMGTIEKLFSEIAERLITVKFVAVVTPSITTTTITKKEVPAQTMPALLFNGFQQIQANYTQTPNELIDTILPYVKPTVGILIMVVFRHTVGTILSPRGDRQHEWIATIRLVREVCNFSEKSCGMAIKEAVELNLITCREVTTDEWKRAKIYPRKGELVFAFSPKWKHQR